MIKMLKMKESVKVHLSRNYDGRLIWVLSAVFAFVASFGRISGYPSSVNVVVSVISGLNFVPAFLGSVLGYIVQGSWETGIIQLCSIIVIGVVRNGLSGKKEGESPGFLGLLTAGVLILFGAVMSVAMSADAYTVSMSMITALICGCVVFIAKTVILRRDYDGIVELSGLNGVYGGVLYIVLIATLTACPFPVLNTGRVLGCFAILCGARKYRHPGGAVMGALTTCGVLLCNPLLAKNTLLLATSGLICGAFVQFGMLATVLAFLGISLISLVAIGINGDTFFMFADMILGSVIYIAVPVSFTKKVAGRITGARNAVDLVGQTASSRLSFASRTLSDIRSQLSLVTAAMDRKSRNTDLKKQVCRTVCSECPMFSDCWKEKRHSSVNAFIKLEETAFCYNCVSSRDVSRVMPMCIKPDEVEQAFNQLYKEILTEKANNIHIKEMRELLSEQLATMEDMLGDLSYRVGQVRAIDPNLSAQVRDYFYRLGYPNAKSCVFTDENHLQRVEVFITSKYAGDTVRLTTAIGSIVDCDFDLPVITEVDGVTKLSFTKQPCYEISVGSFQASSGDNELSGDSFDTVSLSTGERYIILSDGMGTGKRARLDSLFTVNLISRLIKTGASISTAHRLINSILRVKGWEESFATVDLLKLDLWGGSAEFLKAGANRSYLYRDGALKAIGGQAFPAGILSSCIPDISNLKLFDGDMLIMCSDGVGENIIRQVSGILSGNPDCEPKEIAQAMGEFATAQNGGRNPDDITLIVVGISSSNRL